MALWNRKFDYKNGEDRICKDCNGAFYTKKPTLRCRICVNKKMREYVHANKPYQRKEQYPFDNRGTEAANRFCRIRTATSKAWREFEKTGDKSAVVAHYNKQLKEIEENGILKWINDRRDERSKKESKIKSASVTRKDYPDTRGYHEY